MDFELSDEQALIRDTARDFTDREVVPVASANSRNHHLVLMNDIKFLPPVQRADVRELERELMQLMVGLLHEINPERMAAAKVHAPYALLLFGMVIWTFTWYEKNGEISPGELAERISELFLEGFRAG